MSLKRFGGQFRIVVSGIVLVAVLVLVLLQWPMKARFWLYGVEMERTTLLVVVASGLLALLFIWMVRMLTHGIRAVRETRDSVRLKNLEKQVAQGQKNEKPNAPDSAKPPQESV